MKLRMIFNPTIPFGFMDLRIVHNNMDFVIRMFRNDLVHKIQKLPARTALIMAHLHLFRGHVQGCKETTRPMRSVLMADPRQRPAMGQFKPSISPLQRSTINAMSVRIGSNFPFSFDLKDRYRGFPLKRIGYFMNSRLM